MAIMVNASTIGNNLLFQDIDNKIDTTKLVGQLSSDGKIFSFNQNDDSLFRTIRNEIAHGILPKVHVANVSDFSFPDLDQFEDNANEAPDSISLFYSPDTEEENVSFRSHYQLIESERERVFQIIKALVSKFHAILSNLILVEFGNTVPPKLINNTKLKLGGYTG